MQHSLDQPRDVVVRTALAAARELGPLLCDAPALLKLLLDDAVAESRALRDRVGQRIVPCVLIRRSGLVGIPRWRPFLSQDRREIPEWGAALGLRPSDPFTFLRHQSHSGDELR